jgi:hypothetical protein
MREPGRFGGDYASTGDVKQFLRRPELGNAIKVLREYRGKLVTGGRLDESIFRRWTDEWPQSGKQHDAALVIARVATKTLADHRFSDRLEDRYRELLGRLSNLTQSSPRCPINDVLDFIGMLRNSYDKNWTESFWDENIEETRRAARPFSPPPIRPSDSAAYRTTGITCSSGRGTTWSRRGRAGDRGLQWPSVRPRYNRLFRHRRFDSHQSSRASPRVQRGEMARP